VAKIEIIHPIIHGGLEYGCGVHDLPEELAMHFIKTCSHAVQQAQPHSPAGKTTKSADADSVLNDRLWKRMYG
jgi:hypothetical protein